MVSGHSSDRTLNSLKLSVYAARILWPSLASNNAAPSHYLNQSWLIVAWSLGETVHGNLSQNTLYMEMSLKISSTKWRSFISSLTRKKYLVNWLLSLFKWYVFNTKHFCNYLSLSGAWMRLLADPTLTKWYMEFSDTIRSLSFKWNTSQHWHIVFHLFGPTLVTWAPAGQS